VDGLGVYPANSGTIHVDKPSGATVRSAFLGAASTGYTNAKIPAGSILLDGSSFPWNFETGSSINSWNYWADVTALVKPKVDASLAGRVNFTITELMNTYLIDGEILAVIFDDPNQATSNTIVLLFGAQSVVGDTFNIALAEPINTADTGLVLDMSLGISFGAQGCASNQYSRVDVNGTRISTSAGGEDDGVCANGALLTVGGLDDSNTNPANPFATPAGNPRLDDELYNLIPFVSTGDTSITVFTQNPSNDDNIFFASLFLTGEAIVGEGILLSPVSATNYLGETHALTATVQDDNGNPIVGRDVTFTVVSGPNIGLVYTTVTDANGQAVFSYVGNVVGTDIIEASFLNSQGELITSNQVEKIWEPLPNQPPVADANGPYTGDEGSEISLDGTGSSDPDGDPLAYSWTADSTLCSFDDATSAAPKLTCTDNGNFTVTLEVSDPMLASDSATSVVTVYNVAPTVSINSVDPTLVMVGNAVTAIGSFTDPGTNDTHTANWDWGDGVTSGSVSGLNVGPDSHIYNTAGIYTLQLTVTDDDGGSGSASYRFVIVYDPSAGFVTGGGWIDSPAGAYVADPALTDKATFGFVAKYQKGAQVPVGNTEFQFHAAGLNFHSSSYDWLVVTGSNFAQYKGVGTINGVGEYKFKLWAGDGTGTDGADTFRIKIWTEDGLGVESVIYDNGINQDIANGSILIHTK
jgi:PKD repeat protein